MSENLIFPLSAFVFFSAISSGLLAWVLIRVIIRSQISNIFFDNPNKPNAMHLGKIPRLGGVPILVAASCISTAMLMLSNAQFQISWLAIPLLLLVSISLIDDRLSVNAWIRLAIHLLAGAIAIFFIFYRSSNDSALSTAHELPIWLLFVAAFVSIVVVWCTNLYNFMDGANGLAGFMGLIGFGTYAIAATMGASILGSFLSIYLSILSGAIAGACGGFLTLNFPRPRVFMGDAGSVPLGFMMAVFGLIGVINQTWPWWFPLLVFSPFIVDASVTLARRIVKREHIWEGHRQHYYHRLILICGWSHTKVALAYAALMLSVSATGLYLLRTDNLFSVAETHQLSISTPSILWGWVVIYGLLLGYLEWRFLIQKQKKQ